MNFLVPTKFNLKPILKNQFFFHYNSYSVWEILFLELTSNSVGKVQNNNECYYNQYTLSLSLVDKHLEDNQLPQISTYFLQEPVYQVSKDDAITGFFIVIWDTNMRELPEFFTPALQAPVGGA